MMKPSVRFGHTILIPNTGLTKPLTGVLEKVSDIALDQKDGFVRLVYTGEMKEAAALKLLRQLNIPHLWTPHHFNSSASGVIQNPFMSNSNALKAYGA